MTARLRPWSTPPAYSADIASRIVASFHGTAFEKDTLRTCSISLRQLGGGQNFLLYFTKGKFEM